MVQFWAPPISIVGKKYHGTAWLQTFFKISSEQRIHTGLEQHEGE